MSGKMFEFAISAGEGTLIDYGVASIQLSLENLVDGVVNDGETIILARCDDDCQTGE